ncbi:hypothetical protein P8452_65338 [Trifolium repens]|nr:hypothetical protein P8452_65338 [Trifolium repens]
MDFNNNSVPLDYPSTPHLNEAMQNKEEKKFQSFWENQMITLELDKEFKSQLALTRIRKTMKDDADMVSAESQLLMAKACELLIQELTFRAWLNTEERKRITVKPIDVSKAIMETDPFDDFFMDVVSQYCASCVKVENVENLTVANQHENIVQPADIPKAIIENGNELDYENVEKFLYGDQAFFPAAVDFIENDQMEIDQEFVQPFMMQPPFMPSDQFSFNYQPNYVKKIKSLNVSLASANSASRSNIIGWAEKLYGQSICAVIAGVKNLLSSDRQLALARTVEALIEGRPNPEIDIYLAFDPRAPKSG